MADPGQEKEYGRPGDPVADTDIAHQDEPVDVDGKEKEYQAINPEKDAGSSGNEAKSRAALQQTKSYATTASAVSQTSEAIPEKKPWYKTVNPLRWGTPPPVPETRGVSREYTASFLSMVYFGWVGPLMSVSCYKAAENMCILMMMADWVQTRTTTERYMDGESRSRSRQNDNQDAGIF